MATRVFKPQFILETIVQVLPYLGVTFLIVIGTLFFASLIGFLVARAKIKNGIGKYIANLYITVFRCIPSIVLLFLIYYGLPQLCRILFHIDISFWSKTAFVILTFSLLFGANMGEVMRAAYEAVDGGQTEAALCVGLTERQAFFRITFPQAVRYALPNLANIITSLMKEGALAYTIGLIDMMGKGKMIITMNYGAYTLETYLALFIIYWVLTKIVETVFAQMDKRLSRGGKTLAE
jgi:L-cystine transport system permease protein